MSTEEQTSQNLTNALSAGLQSQILEFTSEIRKYDDKDYIGHCKACNERVDRSEMNYKKGHLFHATCADQHSGEFPLDDESINEERRKRVDVAYLKNLEFRIANKQIRKRSPSSKKKKTSVKKRKVKKKTVKRKVKRKSIKREKVAKKRAKPKKKKVTRKKSTTKHKKIVKRKKTNKKRVKSKATRKRRR